MTWVKNLGLSYSGLLSAFPQTVEVNQPDEWGC